MHEQARVWLLHPLLQAGDLLVGDRGFRSFAHLALLARARRAGRVPHAPEPDRRLPPGPHVFRPPQGRGGARHSTQRGKPRSRFVRRLGRHDQLVAWLKPQYKDGPRSWMPRAQFDALPEELTVRKLRYRIVERGRRTREVTVATTLLDPVLYPREAVAESYGIRWRASKRTGAS